MILNTGLKPRCKNLYFHTASEANGNENPEIKLNMENVSLKNQKLNP